MRTILVLDDEALILMFLEDMLSELGFATVSNSRVDEALAAIEAHPIDAAIIDFKLGEGQDSLAVARMLAARGVPFAFATGYGAPPAEQELGPRPTLAKPFDYDRVAAVVQQLLG